MKRTTVTTMLLLAAIGGCKVPDDGPEMPEARQYNTGRASRGGTPYSRTSWKNTTDADDLDDAGDRPARSASTMRSTRPATRVTQTSSSMRSCEGGMCRSGSCSNGSCSRDEINLNDPAVTA